MNKYIEYLFPLSSYVSKIMKKKKKLYQVEQIKLWIWRTYKEVFSLFFSKIHYLEIILLCMDEYDVK